MSTGVLTALAGSPFNSGTNNPVGYASDSRGRLFVTSLTTAQVRAYTTASGVPTGAGTTLTAVIGSPFAAGGTFTTALALSSDSRS